MERVCPFSLFVVCRSTFSIITSLYNTTIDTTVQFYYRIAEHATEDGVYIQDRGYILGQGKGAASSIPVYCAFALAFSNYTSATIPDLFKATGRLDIAHD